MASVGDGQSKTRAACCLSGQIAPGAAARARAARSLGRASAASGRDLPGRFSTSCVIASGKVPSRSPASPPHHPSSSRTDLSGSLAARQLRLPSLDRPPPARARQHLRVYYRLLGSLNSLVASLYIHHVNWPRLTSTRQPVAGALAFPSAAQSVRSRHARRRLTVTSRCDTNSLRRRAAAAAADTRRKPTATNRAVL